MRSSLSTPLALSVLVHGALGASLVLLGRGVVTAAPPVYKVDLVAAPAGPRNVGEVSSAPAPPAPAAAPPPKSAAAPPGEKVPVKAAPPKRPTPAPTTAVPNAKTSKPTAPVAKAGGGATGGQGTDVANIKSEGIAFPFPTYLNNIANQVILRFERGSLPALSCDVYFQIHRDGSVSDIELRRRSGSTLFDIEARGAVEAAGRSRAFGPLPDGFKDDVLPVIFTFTPQMIRE